MTAAAISSGPAPKVSICIPAYRQVEFLRITLESVAAQDFTDYEVIVTDDSPTEEVHDLVAGFPLGGRLFYYRNQVPLGSPENWNASIRRARGELVKILHHDDRFTSPSSLRQFVEMLDNAPEADFGFSAALVDDVASGIDRVHRPSAAQLHDLGTRPAVLFLGNFIGAPSATICRRSLAIEYDRRMKWLVDLDFYMRALALNPNFAYCETPLITTPTNAEHQVTEICRDNGTVELTEYLLLFSKLSASEREQPEVHRGWYQLFRRYRIRKLRDFARYDAPMPADAEYFKRLLRKAPSRASRLWQLMRSPKQTALKVFYRVYPHVPAVIRAPIKKVVAWRRTQAATQDQSPKRRGE